MENFENTQYNSVIVEQVFYAGFWRRFVGWLIDFLIIIVTIHWVNVLVSNIIKTPIPDTINISAIFTSFFSNFINYIFDRFYCYSTLLLSF